MLYEYLKSSSLPLVVVFLFLNFTYQAFAVLSAYWLSDWSDTNIGIKNGTTANMNKEARMAAFAMFGLIQRKFSFFVFVVFYFIVFFIYTFFRVNINKLTKNKKLK